MTFVWCNYNYPIKRLVEVWGLEPDCAVCVVDDDFIYLPDFLSTIQKEDSKHTKSILGFVGKQLYRRGDKLSMWFRQSKVPKLPTGCRHLYLAAGLGTWYQPETLDEKFQDQMAFSSIVPGRGADIWFWAAAVSADSNQVCIASKDHPRLYIPIPETNQTAAWDRPSADALEERFQKAVDFFGIREKLIRELPDHGDSTPTSSL